MRKRTPHPRHTIKPSVCFLLGIWGDSYIHQFFNLGLRSLLAPGNIPAMAKSYECSFIFLTRPQDQPTLVGHPLFQLLEQYCQVQWINIEDLLFAKNYSATLTIAYERGMRSRGSAMVDTYFIYLVSDYIMADGSLRGLMRYMSEGYSGITSGNFQVVEETMREQLQKQVSEHGILSLPPRELLAQGMRHLHPITVANTVNQPFSYTTHTNRLFWHVDEQTLIGRFYLRHMLSIRPETEDYVIGASCDYSYIHEMCPSGNVAAIVDSDEYCVIELQPQEHEQKFVHYGRHDKVDIIKTLSEWTTAGQRANIYNPVIFHAGEIPPETERYLAESEQYVRSIDSKFTTPPMPARGHPYWISCIEWCLYNLLDKPGFSERYVKGVFAGILGSPVFEPPLGHIGSDYLMLRTRRQYKDHFLRRVWHHLQGLRTGFTTRPGFWHPYWGEFRKICAHLDHTIPASAKILFVTDTQNWLVDRMQERYGDNVLCQQSDLFLLRPLEQLSARLGGKSTHAVILTTNVRLSLLQDVVSRCRALLAPGGSLTLLMIHKNGGGKYSLSSCVALTAPLLMGMNCKKVYFHFTPGRRILDALCLPNLHMALRTRRKIFTWRRVRGVMVVATVCGLYTISNLLSLFGLRFGFSQATCVIAQLQMPGTDAHDMTVPVTDLPKVANIGR